MRAKLLLLCLIICDPVDCRFRGSSVQGLLQVRVPEGTARPSSRESSPPKDWNCVSYVSGIGRQVLYLGSPKRHVGNLNAHC